MFKAVSSPYLVPFDGTFAQIKAPTKPPKNVADKTARKAKLTELVAELAPLQHILYAHSQHSVLLVFQAMDAAGKDSTIRAVLSGVDPAGCEVTSFKRPSETELAHDFLWRTTQRLPQRGHLGVFNRSYYEEVLAVRVHPDFLIPQNLPFRPKKLADLWRQRYDSICEHEQHLARNGTVILKFWLNVSRDEQRDRLLARLDEPAKNWKFEYGDLSERALWKDYMSAYQDALNATSRPHAPWYAIPADSKSFMRMTVADILVRTLKSLDLKYPTLEKEELAKFDEMKAQLLSGK
ncbi:PPK2 family polyphosphate kinase [Stenotrophobium rhamnosiphilum]|uniref:Phosphate--nucleotide phosphotransferase n=1 Tax=Stenotrophobium rhamnosiphilum TaxID=2029166 RepID=A0A2T5MFG5_9GAMM|nr:PPK2 family polyphosphate kinase [Stenotrophobium rhamnosiphilum]PTU31289.1 phosphate--nucleotide phosphotransferase [Stenotrophobium rhamnosiphilum]